MENETYKQAQIRDKVDVSSSLDPLVKKWFYSRFEDFSEAQRYGVLPIFERKSILISAPTGGTKTLTAFLSILNYLVSLAKKGELEKRTYAVYCSPLKALSNDIYVNLLRPLEEIEALAGEENINLQKIRVGLRTGDTTANERAKMSKNPPNILITTPESLAIMINSPKFSENFNLLEFAIIDEIHSLAENKRGVHLTLTLERLQERSVIQLTRVGLSATIAPLEKVAGFLVGYEKKKQRECLIANIEETKKLDLEVISPVENFLETNTSSFYHDLYSLIDNLIQKNKTTLIFTNTRAATERVVHNLKEKFPSNYIENIGAHHSSLSKEHRFDVEDKLRKGKLKVVVCSTSLELGIDVGYIDLVLLLGSPKSVSRAMQRIGRAGHKLHETARGKFIVTDNDDLIECSVILKNSKEKIIDEVHIPENCLDLLAQQIYGMAIYKVWKSKEMYELIKRSYCYRNLTKDDFFSVISYLSGEYELEKNYVYAKIWYDSETGEIGKRGKLARVIYMTNIGTIPDESFVSVVLRSGESVGKIDELFLEKLRKGDVFVLGGNRYQFLYSKGMKVYVIHSERTPTIPSWYSEQLPLSFTTACSIGNFRKLLNEMFERKKSPNEIGEFIMKKVYCNAKTSEAIFNYFNRQFKYSIVPHEERLLIEHYRDGQRNYILFHSLYGRRVNDALSRAVGFLAAARKKDVEIGINDNGFFVAGKELDLDKVEKGFKKLIQEKDKIYEILEEALDKTEVLKRRFRHCAARGLMILRNYKGRFKSVGRQQMSSHFLLSAVKKKTKNFPILMEAKREVLADLMDIENTKKVLDLIKSKKIKIETVRSDVISPFAINLLLESHADVIRIEDKIEFIKRVYSELERNG